MQPLEPPDSFHLNAALGWLGLGDHCEANEELDKLAPALHVHPDVLEVRWQICAMGHKWEAGMEVAAALLETAPERVSGWIDRAYALRRVAGGGLQAAREALQPAFDKFPGEPTVPYNLACYACQLGNLQETREWLEKAFAVGDAKELKLMAMDDPDLKPFWTEMDRI